MSLTRKDQVEATIADSAAGERLSPRRLLGKRSRAPAAGGKGGADAEEAEAVWISVSALVDSVAAEMAARRPVTTWWERAAGIDYVRHGRAYARAGFARSYGVAQQVLDEWGGRADSAGLELVLDDAADVLMELIVQEERGVFKEGGPVFPFRNGGRSRFADEERSFDQLTREAGELHARIQRVDDAATAAAAAAEEALQTMGRGGIGGLDVVKGGGADNGAAANGPSGPDGAAAQALRWRSVSPEDSSVAFHHRVDVLAGPRQS